MIIAALFIMGCTDGIDPTNELAENASSETAADSSVEDAAAAAAAIKADLDEAADDLSIDFSTGDSASSVVGDLSLPVTGLKDTTVSWSSSNTDFVSADGKITRPAPGETDAEVTLTATIKKGDATTTETFTVTVPATKIKALVIFSSSGTTRSDIVGTADSIAAEIGYKAGDTVREKIDNYLRYDEKVTTRDGYSKWFSASPEAGKIWIGSVHGYIGVSITDDIARLQSNYFPDAADKPIYGLGGIVSNDSIADGARISPSWDSFLLDNADDTSRLERSFTQVTGLGTNINADHYFYSGCNKLGIYYSPYAAVSSGKPWSIYTGAGMGDGAIDNYNSGTQYTDPNNYMGSSAKWSYASHIMAIGAVLE